MKNPEIKEGICPEAELAKGIFLGKALVKVQDNQKAFTTVLNTTHYKVKINSI